LGLVAGVSFTRDPLTGDDEFFLLNFSKGLGEQVVSGAVIPEHVNLPREERAARRISHPLFTYTMFEEMRKSLLWIEALFGTPQDVEWCFDLADSLWLLQSRPITTLSNDYLCVSEHLELPLHITKDVLSSKNTMESMSFVPTALTWTTFSEVIDSALQQRYSQKQIDYYKFCGENRSFYELRQGHVYQNVTLTCELNREEFGVDFTSTAEDFGLDSSSLAQLLLSSHQSKATAPSSVTGSFSLLKTLWSSGTVADAAAATIERELDYCIAERKRLKEALPEFAALDDVHSTFEVLLDRFKDLATTYIDVTIHASIFEAAISTFLGPENRHLMAPLTAHVGGVYTAAQNEKLMKVAKELELLLPIKKDLVLSLMEKTATAPHESLKNTVDYVQTFLDQFGFRAEMELEVSCSRWWDNSSRFLDMIHLMNSNLSQKTAASTPTPQGAQKDKETIIYEMSNWMTKPVLRWAVNQLNSLMRLRENGKYVVVFFIALSRMIVLEAANRLETSKVLSHAEDVFHLPLNDFRQLFRGLLKDPVEIKRCISGNLALRRRWLRSSMQGEIIGFKAVVSQKHQISSSDVDTLQGTAASPGVVEGVARVILLDDQSMSDLSLYHHPEVMKFREDEILVARTTNPAWTPLFLKSKGIVVEFGGLLSHGAITARELGLPAIVAVREISKIRTGDTIIVDGDRGIVKIVKRAPAPIVPASPAPSSPALIVPDDEIL
jgi:rifampicin phosphotransferase